MAACSIMAIASACTVNQTPSGLSPESQQATTPTATLRLGYIALGSSKAPAAPTGWALQQGILKQELQEAGIANDVKVVGFPNGPDLNEALVAGELDVSIYGDTPAIIARTKGVPTRLIAQEQVGMNTWLLAKKNGARSIADLKGQTVATSKGSYAHRYLIGLLQEAGIDKDVTVVHLYPKDAEAALERGDIAAYAAPVGTGPLLLAKGYPLLDEAANHPQLEGSSLIVATEKVLQQHPDLPQIWNQVREDALKEMQANPEAYYQFHAQVSGLPIEAIRASYPIEQFSVEPFPTQGLSLLNGTKQFLVSEKLTNADFQLTDWILEK
ncbi:ABC transporter substrate-binding protein [Phormidium tenue FACHB-886]|nr:ABC transporter substrate-binding protein [Phormidium tenue FACHB-886]